MAVKRKFTGMQKDEIRRKLAKVKKKMKDIKAYTRLLALRMYSQGSTNKEISEALGYSVQYVSELVTKYINEGIESIITDKRTSNNYRMSYEEEEEFLEEFMEIAEAGQVLTVSGILSRYEEVTGKPSCTSTIYALLKRHGWRKVKPRPENPGKASDEEIELSKKNFEKSTGYCWQKTEKSMAM